MRAADLADELPMGSRVWDALGLDAAWTNAEHLLATLVDAVAWGNWQRGKKGAPKPDPLPRPEKLRERADADARIQAKAAAFIAKQQRQQQQ